MNAALRERREEAARRQREALISMEAAVRVLDEDGPTELAVTMVQASVREAEVATALWQEFE